MHEGSNPSRPTLVELIRTYAVQEFAEPVELASGARSNTYVEMTHLLGNGAALEFVCHELLEVMVDCDAVGGPSMGANPLVCGISLLSSCPWFVFRKDTRKGVLEGTRLSPGMDVVICDDVVTSGGSLLWAVGVARELGLNVVQTLAVVDRGAVDRSLDVPYSALVTYADLDLEPVGEP